MERITDLSSIKKITRKTENTRGEFINVKKNFIAKISKSAIEKLRLTETSNKISLYYDTNKNRFFIGAGGDITVRFRKSYCSFSVRSLNYYSSVLLVGRWVLDTPVMYGDKVFYTLKYVGVAKDFNPVMNEVAEYARSRKKLKKILSDKQSE